MNGRIGALHVRYRVAAGMSLGPALVPGMQRAIQTRLADAVASHLTQWLGDDETVVVIREAHASVALGRADWVLDSRIVDKIGRASADAIAARIGEPVSPDSLVRFSDQAEFVGSFIVELLDGVAWDRWYFGAFRRYRRDGLKESVSAVLADNEAHAPRVFSWLERRGRLGALIELFGPGFARCLVMDDSETRESARLTDAEPLAAAAFDLLRALGWTVGGATARSDLLFRYLAQKPVPACWTDRRSLTAWVLQFMRFTLKQLVSKEVQRRDPPEAKGIDRLLNGPLDWLDGRWLARELATLSADRGVSPGAGDAPLDPVILTGRATGLLDPLAGVARDPSLRRALRAADRDTLKLRLMAMISGASPECGLPSPVVTAVLERLVDAVCRARTGPADGHRLIAALDAPLDEAPAPRFRDPALLAALDAARQSGPEAAMLLRELVSAVIDDDEEPGEPTQGAGLFLLIRALLDTKLRGLAGAGDVPFGRVLGAMAGKLLGLRQPFDGPTALWVGSNDPDPAGLDPFHDRLLGMEVALQQLLLDQRVVEPAAMPPLSVRAGLSPLVGCSRPIDLVITRITVLVLRAWTHWLPGLGASSAGFVVRNCLRRDGRVAVSDEAIDVHLGPAPLDVVVEMAGYFRPLERVPWLNDRTIRFAMLRRRDS